jgi:RES domain-containing protein
MPTCSVSQYLKELDSFSALVTTSTANRLQLAWPHFQGPPTAAAQDAAIYDHANAAKIYLFMDHGTINGLLVPHLTANNDVSFAIGDRPSNLSHFKTTIDKFGAGIWSVMTKVTARTNGFVTSSTSIVDAKTVADDNAGLSDVDFYKKLGFEAYDSLAVDDWGPVCTVIPVTMPLPPGCPVPHRLTLDDLPSINSYIDNSCSAAR